MQRLFGVNGEAWIGKRCSEDLLTNRAYAHTFIHFANEILTTLLYCRRILGKDGSGREALRLVWFGH